MAEICPSISDGPQGTLLEERPRDYVEYWQDARSTFANQFIKLPAVELIMAEAMAAVDSTAGMNREDENTVEEIAPAKPVWGLTEKAVRNENTVYLPLALPSPFPADAQSDVEIRLTEALADTRFIDAMKRRPRTVTGLTHGSVVIDLLAVYGNRDSEELADVIDEIQTSLFLNDTDSLEGKE